MHGLATGQTIHDAHFPYKHCDWIGDQPTYKVVIVVLILHYIWQISLLHKWTRKVEQQVVACDICVIFFFLLLCPVKHEW